jgi:excisionase family DNA binding protein
VGIGKLPKLGEAGISLVESDSAMKTENGSGATAVPEDPRALLTAEEVAERLRVTKCWIYAEVRAGRLPHVRLGRYVRFRARAIDAWIEQIERGGRPTNGAGRT